MLGNSLGSRIGFLQAVMVLIIHGGCSHFIPKLQSAFDNSSWDFLIKFMLFYVKVVEYSFVCSYLCGIVFLFFHYLS